MQPHNDVLTAGKKNNQKLCEDILALYNSTGMEDSSGYDIDEWQHVHPDLKHEKSPPDKYEDLPDWNKVNTMIATIHRDYKDEIQLEEERFA
jgi:hypothetical protein